MNADYLASLLREELKTDTSWQISTASAHANFQHREERARESNWSEKLCMYFGESGFGGDAELDYVAPGSSMIGDAGTTANKELTGRDCSLGNGNGEDFGWDGISTRLPMYAAGAFCSSECRDRFPSLHDCYSGEVPQLETGDATRLAGAGAGSTPRNDDSPFGATNQPIPESIPSTSESFRHRGISSFSGGSAYNTANRAARSRVKLHRVGSSEFEAGIPDVLRQVQSRYLPARTFPGLLGAVAGDPPAESGGREGLAVPSGEPFQHLLQSSLAIPPEFSLPGHFWLLARALYLLRRFHCWSCAPPSAKEGSGSPSNGEDICTSSSGTSTRKRAGILSLRLRRRTLERIISSADESCESECGSGSSILLSSAAAATDSDDVNAFENAMEGLDWSNYNVSELLRVRNQMGAKNEETRGSPPNPSTSSTSSSSSSNLSSNCAELSIGQATWVALLSVYVLQRQELRRRSRNQEPNIPLSSTLTILASALAVQNKLNQTHAKGVNKFTQPTADGLRGLDATREFGGGEYTRPSQRCGCMGQSGVSIVSRPRSKCDGGSLPTEGTVLNRELAAVIPSIASASTSEHRPPTSCSVSNGIANPFDTRRPHTTAPGGPPGTALRRRRVDSSELKFLRSAPQQFRNGRKQKPAILQVCSRILADVKSNKSLFPMASKKIGTGPASTTSHQPSSTNGECFAVTEDAPPNHRLLRGIGVYIRDCVTVLEIIQQFCFSLFVGSAWVDEQDPLSTKTLSDFMDTAFQVLETFKPCRSAATARLLLASETGSQKSETSFPGQSMRSHLKRLAAATATSIYFTVTPTCLQAHGILESVIEGHRASAGCAVCREGSLDSTSSRNRHPAGDPRLGLGRPEFEKNLFHLISSINYETRISGSTIARSGHVLIKTIELSATGDALKRARAPSGSIASMSTVALPALSADGCSDISTHRFSEQFVYV